MKLVRVRAFIAAAVGACLVTGCSFTGGALEPHTQFIYPNSNVTILGPVSSSRTKNGFLGLSPFFNASEVFEIYREALSQQAGANVIVNLEETSTVVTFPFYVTYTYSISGQGARMEVGRQELR